MTQLAVRRALISVYDKTGLEDLGLALQAAGVQVANRPSEVPGLVRAALG